MKIYHVGTASATANRIGLIHFLKDIFPKIEHLDFILEFIGDVEPFIAHSFPAYMNHPKIKFHGFVKDIDNLIEDEMIHIVPYKETTGTRTRVGNLVRFKPCLIGYPNLSDSYPFLQNNFNCLTANRTNEFVSLLHVAIVNKDVRVSLAKQIQKDIEHYEANSRFCICDE